MRPRFFTTVTSCVFLLLNNYDDDSSITVGAFQLTNTAPNVHERHQNRHHRQRTNSVVVLHQSSIVDVVDSQGAVASSPIRTTKKQQQHDNNNNNNNFAIAAPPRPRLHVPLLQLALAGSATTFFADACIHPIDCIKTIQQSDLGAELSFVQAASYLFETSGISGFYHGLLTYACSDAVGGAMKFAVWETWKKKFSSEESKLPGAALAFMVASVAIVPGEFLKQQLQMSHFETLGDALSVVYQNNGLSGFFHGYDAVVFRDVPHTMLELCLYDTFKRAGSLLPKDTNGQTREVHPVLAACLTGSIAGFMTTPMDAIKTKIMVDTGGTSYDSVWDCLATTIDSHGWGGIWAGALARVFWIAPFTMLYLPTYDFLHKALLERHLERHHHRRVITTTDNFQ